jgi:putative ATPase
LSAVRDGLSEIKKAIEQLHKGGTLFIDEIHRLTRPQQDVLLPVLESGSCWLLAATTENPSAVLTPALLSRIRSYRVHPLSTEDISNVLNFSLTSKSLRANELADDKKKQRLIQTWIPLIAKKSSGDARLALNILEGLIHCEDESAEQDLLAGQLRAWTAQSHYDYASAMIKSMRGSDPDAALFYAHAAIESGEDPIFLLRRCIIFASEDIGNADPNALRIAVDCAVAFERLGLPEGRYALAQAVCYLSATVKSNSLLKALNHVKQWWQSASDQIQNVSPPAHLILKGHEKYRYPHDFPDNFVREQYLPNKIEAFRQQNGSAYLPSEVGVEARLKARLQNLWKKQ